MSVQNFVSPFSDPSATLQEYLADNNIRRLINWMITDDYRLVTQTTNSNWESADIMNFLMQADTIYRDRDLHEEKLDHLRKIAKNTYSWLIGNIRTYDEPNYLSWDDCIWDTGLVTYSIVWASRYFGIDIFPDKKKLYDTLL